MGFVSLIAGLTIGHIATRSLMQVPKPITAVTPSPVESPTKTFARGIMVPLVPFDNAPLEDAVDYLRTCSRTGIEIDGMPKPYRLNYIIVDPHRVAKPITLRLQDIRLDELCERIAQVSGMTVSFDRDAIVFAEPTKGEQVADGNRPQAPQLPENR